MTTNPRHVVLGGNGVIGRETLRALIAAGERPTSVGRRPSTIAEAQSLTADLLSARDVTHSLRGAEVAYLTAGLPYSARVWADHWPVILDNAIAAALENGVHLVYLDNVYAYGPVDGVMTEQTPLAPRSKKGEVRAAALRSLRAAQSQGLTVTIGRSADFYGPGATTSVFNTFALDKIAVNKTGTWLFDADQPHSLTYTPDIGKALVTLGTNPAARNGTWHLPTAPAMTGRQYLEVAAGPGARTAVMRPTTMRLGALFNLAARETLEMDYQYTRPYLFDSRAFETTFGETATPTARGVAASLVQR
ncbi:NAD-dependent epimerase/dehydratase family protein (plasmid) [Rathayibacter sp. VKM Ac-2803]|uniref:NAD-dependent dehydratase n=1 Tax=Rathayibacter caricis DSM 15933 TaxID=1328867 RepID=A0A2T4UNW9_9MICO|nr:MULTISPECIES: NAD-dependent epimerase/dehydratase family protein [Rathayibacter]MWV51396.1 NAD-dependent epimerase/dehydratase family protein [Rathayibacter sp. VKM Ac-2803]PTL71223.1 NAD-dependent dehydratase [Rathayibacter caricis DSM 15933]